MRTEDLVRMLATGEQASALDTPGRRFAIAGGWGAFGAVLLMSIFLGVRPDLPQAVLLPMFWAKLGFVLLIALLALLATLRLARPGVPLGWISAGIAAPVIALWALAIAVYAGADAADRATLVFGLTWQWCPARITGLSAPAFAAAMWAIRGLAPTRLRTAGAAAGLLAGGIGASAYALHCPELAAPFLAIWYVIGLLIPTAVGAALGPRLLRW